MLRVLTADPRIKPPLQDIMSLPVVVRVNDFDADEAARFAQAVNRAVRTGQPVVPVLIDSVGGCVYSLLAMINTIRQCPTPVATVVEAKAMSAGAALFAMGKTRYMAPTASLMLHEVHSFTSGKPDDLRADAKETNRLNKLIFDLTSANCGYPENHFLDALRRQGNADWYLDGKQAKKLGLATHLHVPSLAVNVSVSVTFG